MGCTNLIKLNILNDIMLFKLSSNFFRIEKLF